MPKQKGGKNRQSSGIKLEHHMINGLRQYLEERIALLPGITAIFPGRINHVGHPVTFRFRVQRVEGNAVRCLCRSGDAAQEVFISSSEPLVLAERIRAIVA